MLIFVNGVFFFRERYDFERPTGTGAGTAMQIAPSRTSARPKLCRDRCRFANMKPTEPQRDRALSVLVRFEHRQPWHLRLLGWDCEDECGHQCMWKTVDYFDSFDERVQFRGKWPFVRWLGLQEPASVFFSLLNLFAHIYGWSEFSRRVAPNNRFYALWKTHAYLAMNAWLWSTAFHSRDIPITEFMDYFGAFSIVLYSLYALVARMIMDKLESAVQWLVQVAFICFFIFHLYYMLNVKFDYQYHITLNITTGIINSAGWLYWTWTNRGRPYAAKCAFVVISLLALSSLEVLDFSPVWFIFDAHSLWHLGTAPLPLIWYRFLIDDCRYENIKAKAQPTVPPATGRTLTRRGFARVKELLKEINVLNIHNDDGFTLD
ncbi:post-GPI attachment to proteins factor 3-like isoform X2 [Varroa destructor]|uniref:Post-GPI attachment to proteins factor 3 n=2 Tax=Varroa destructor TaxID=109461 RepID=A0A7M7J2Q4_VARDE|nr:post-GPI attachment to proteins factor 3-like isoform X2 [Varroa destructor]